jgi:hypothetical protein
VPALISALKNEHTKRILCATRIRPPAVRHGTTAHYRMPVLEAAGGYLVLGRYRGPEIPRSEWEDLTYTTYATDPPRFRAGHLGDRDDGAEGFWEYGKADLEGVWTKNASKCPALVKWVESTGARFGHVQQLRMPPNTLRECRWGCTWITTTRATRPPTAGSCGCGWSARRQAGTPVCPWLTSTTGQGV